MSMAQELCQKEAGLGINRGTVTKYLQFLMILELYLELSYFFSKIAMVVQGLPITVTLDRVTLRLQGQFYHLNTFVYLTLRMTA